MRIIERIVILVIKNVRKLVQIIAENIENLKMEKEIITYKCPKCGCRDSYEWDENMMVVQCCSNCNFPWIIYQYGSCGHSNDEMGIRRYYG